jgi:Arc/MetJ family transcription regulator
MKTTLVIDDALIGRVKREAGKQKKTLSEFVEMALRTFLKAHGAPSKKLRPLPTFDGGGCVVDVSDRDALYRSMEGR